MTAIPHFGFILAAYGFTALVLGSTLVAIVIDGRAQKRMLAQLERRSAKYRAGSPEIGEGA